MKGFFEGCDDDDINFGFNYEWNQLMDTREVANTPFATEVISEEDIQLSTNQKQSRVLAIPRKTLQQGARYIFKGEVSLKVFDKKKNADVTVSSVVSKNQ